MHLGDALRWFRTYVGINQTEAGLRMGFPPKSAQTSVSQRERPADHPDYTELRVTEIYRLEVASKVPAGTLLRHAGFVDDDELSLPAELSPTIRASILHMIDLDLQAQQSAGERREVTKRKTSLDDLFPDGD
jgi:hypothetical protein